MLPKVDLWPPHTPTHPSTFMHKRRLQNSVKPYSKPCINICSCSLTIQVQKNMHLDNKQTRKSGTIFQKWGIEFSFLDHSRKRRTEEHTENRW